MKNQQQNQTSLPANELKASQAGSSSSFPQGSTLPVRSGTERFDQAPVTHGAVQGAWGSLHHEMQCNTEEGLLGFVHTKL